MNDGTKQAPERRPVKIETKLHGAMKAIAAIKNWTLEEAGDEAAKLLIKKFGNPATK